MKVDECEEKISIKCEVISQAEIKARLRSFSGVKLRLLAQSSGYMNQLMMNQAVFSVVFVPVSP